MSYQVLARKWRPPDFSSLVGQDHVVTALRNALGEGRIAQAYLFSGIRGVGKTTAARVLAKALNCLNGADGGPATEPCNECASCSEINSGGTMDVLEVDAATYSKVEQVRELTETLRYGPARGRYKVVVLDEVHRLSRQAFDALLKIVEEPPAHLVFIFATTEIDAVPATILSRCQEFQFRRVPSAVVAAHLRRICEAEGITASDAALRLIARAGEGSVRDAVALLDQMATFGNATISDDDAAQLLAGFDAALFQRLLAAILEGRAGEVRAVAHEVEAAGWDPHHVFGQFLGFCRDAMHLALGGDPDSVDLPAEEARTLADLVRGSGNGTGNGSGYEAMLQILHLLLGSEPTVRRSEFGSVALEVAWLRAAELPKVQQIERLLSGRAPMPPKGPGGSGSSGSGSSGAGSTGHGSSSGGARVGGHTSRTAAPTETSAENRPSRAIHAEPIDTIREDLPATKIGSAVEASAPTDPALSAAVEEDLVADAQPSRLAPDQVDTRRLADLLELVAARRQSLAGLLRTARLGLGDGEIVIAPVTEDRMIEKALERKPNLRAFDEALAHLFGGPVAWRIDSHAKNLEPVLEPPPREKRERQVERRNGTPARRPGQDARPTGRRNGTSAGASPSSDAPPADVYESDYDEAAQNGSLFEDPMHQGEGSLDRPQRETTAPSNEAVRSNDAAQISPEALRRAEELPTVRLVRELFRGNIQSVRDEHDPAGADLDAH